MNPKLSAFILTLLLLPIMLVPATANADVLLIPDVETSDTRPEFPQNGLSMSTVQQQYGEPLIKHPAIGEPPITRWEYQDFTVFFENDKVITAVQKSQHTENSDKE